MAKRKRELDPRFFQGIAHRGLHDETATENGMAAFAKAIEAGLAFEFDLHLSKDGELIVVHDSSLKRVTGKEGVVEELTLQEIKENYRLLDGEEIPTFREILAKNDYFSPMVVELKVEKGNYKALAKATLEALKDCPDPKLVTIISFDPRALWACRKGPFSRGLLIFDKRTDVLFFRRFFEYLDVETTLLDHPKVVSFREKGHPINVWTVNDPNKLASAAAKADMITFEKLPVAAVKEAIAHGRKDEK